MIKTRQARLTTRAEALAALRRENESRRAKKMIEASMKIIESENAKFAEYQKRRHEQLERLKTKLRAKREKMLQQYREELLQAINESPDPTERNLHRRDLLDNYDEAEDESRKNTMITDPEKLAYIMRYRPIKYTPREDSSKSEEEESYVPVVEVLRAYEPRRRLTSSRKASQSKIYRENESEEHEPSKDRKRSVPLDEQTREDDIFDADDEQESQSTNVKRSPYSLIDREATINRPPPKKPPPMDGDSGEYYAEMQARDGFIHQLPDPREIPSYYPSVVYPGEDLIPLHIAYDHQQQGGEMYHVNPAYKHLANHYYGVNLEQQSVDRNHHYGVNHQAEQRVQQERPAASYYSTNHEVTQQQPAEQHQKEVQETAHQQQPEQYYYNDNQQAAQQQQQVQNYQLNSPQYEEAEQEPVDQNYRKTKRSSLKVLEIDPSTYEDDDPDYNVEEQFAKPSSRYSVRTYRHEPYTSRRYRREADIKIEENGPLFFSLGLEESKMHKKQDNDASKEFDFIKLKDFGLSLLKLFN